MTDSQTVAADVVDAIDAEERAYKEALQQQTEQVAGYLLQTLGQRLTAIGVGSADPRPVKRWSEGGEIRQRDQERRLRLLFRMTRAIQLVYDEETARAYLQSSSPYLDDRTPLLLIADLEIEDDESERRIVQALRAFLEV